MDTLVKDASGYIRPGYLGKHKEERYKEWNNLYGPGGWQLIWLWGDCDWFSFAGACNQYEYAYVCFLNRNKPVLKELVSVACDVYDDNPSNVASGTNYSIQETGQVHIQDIAIRRAVRRCNRVFKGQELVQIRLGVGKHHLSDILNPGKVPFHKPEKILKPFLEGWWDPGSVECFYQSNRVLRIN